MIYTPLRRIPIGEAVQRADGTYALRIEAFTFSPSWTQALESAWLFTQNGCTLEGMVEINDRCKVILSDEHEKRHALMFRVQEG